MSRSLAKRFLCLLSFTLYRERKHYGPVHVCLHVAFLLRVLETSMTGNHFYAEKRKLGSRWCNTLFHSNGKRDYSWSALLLYSDLVTHYCKSYLSAVMIEPKKWLHTVTSYAWDIWVKALRVWVGNLEGNEHGRPRIRWVFKSLHWTAERNNKTKTVDIRKEYDMM